MSHGRTWKAWNHLIQMFYECTYCMCGEEGEYVFSHILNCQFTLQQRIQGTIRVFLELISADLAAKKTLSFGLVFAVCHFKKWVKIIYSIPLI